MTQYVNPFKLPILRVGDPPSKPAEKERVKYFADTESEDSP